LGDAVQVVRSAAGPQDVVVAVLDVNGWLYYSRYYDGKALDARGIDRVPLDRTLLVNTFLSPQIDAFVSPASRSRSRAGL
jgi:hypothetical protein